MRIIAPSILSCDFMNLKEEIKRINESLAQWIHFDVMDGHFVPNISFGPDIFKYFKNNSSLLMDVHIMVTNPQFVGDLFIKAGADQIVFHYEACADDHEVSALIKHFKDQDIKVGLSLKPHTSIDVIETFLKELDLVLIMAVEPGFGGQKFMVNALDKLKYLKEYRTINHLEYLIQVDGGISNENKELCYKAGADCLVAGSYLFKQDNFNDGVNSLL
ncbi:MAG: ribulose-phosphate 3-epimerase [Bacilli bacterium]|jgi:ribulose-phosphate 3-epimerase|nr:ribulose-phosphate 3-epimerase [Bacilli bacterium]